MLDTHGSATAAQVTAPQWSLVTNGGCPIASHGPNSLPHYYFRHSTPLAASCRVTSSRENRGWWLLVQSAERNGDGGDLGMQVSILLRFIPSIPPHLLIPLLSMEA